MDATGKSQMATPGNKSKLPPVRLNAITMARIATWKVTKPASTFDAGSDPRRTEERKGNTGGLRRAVNAQIAVSTLQKQASPKMRTNSPRAQPNNKVNAIVRNYEERQSEARKTSTNRVAAKPTQKTNVVKTDNAKPGEKASEKVLKPTQNTNLKTQVSKPGEKATEMNKASGNVEKFVDLPINQRPSVRVKIEPWAGESRRDSPTKIILKEIGTTDSWGKIATPKDKGREEEEEEKQDEPSDGKPPSEVDVSKKEAFVPVIFIDDSESIRSSLEDEIDINHPRAIDLAKKSERTLWREIPAVVNSGILEKLSKEERTRQETKFEVMYSEATYLHSLNILKKHYMGHIEKHIPQVLTLSDYNKLFADIVAVRDCSEKLLKQLDEHWQEDIMLDDIYEVVRRFASSDEFKMVYLKFFRNMHDMRKRLQELTETNEGFRTLVDLLANRQSVQKLTLDSFLTSPMQRITKMPLLMKTILDTIQPGSQEFEKCTSAYEAASKIAQECNEVVHEKKRIEEMLKLSQLIEFPSEVKSIPIMTPTRTVVDQGDALHFAIADKSTKKEKLKLILFNDLLLVAKKKWDKQLSVVDYCPRDQVFANEMENPSLYGHSDMKNTNPVIITMLCNSANKKVDLMVTIKDPQTRRTWLNHLGRESEDENAVRVIAIAEHEAANPDELTICPGDLILITGEEVDGWCQGQLLTDGSKGKFLVSKTQKIRSANKKPTKDGRQSQVTGDNS